jgi:hypothetical protein
LQSPAKEGRDIGGILPLTQNAIVNRRSAKEEDNHEAEEIKKEDPATRETSARRIAETGQAKAQTAAGGDGESVKSCEKIGCSRHGVSWEGANNGREEVQEKLEYFTGAPRATCCRDECKVGCKASCRGE